MLGCNPPEALADGGTPTRVVWSRAAAIHDTPETVRDAVGKPEGLGFSTIAPTDVGPETVIVMAYVPFDSAPRRICLGTIRGIDPEHVRPDDDPSPTVSIWHFGTAGAFDTRGWKEDRSGTLHHRASPEDGPVSTNFERVLDHMTAQPFLVVVETERRTQWRCLVLHKRPAPHIADAIRARLVDDAGDVRD